MKLSGLFAYPVKSSAGNPLASTKVRNTGLAFDREWMVTDVRGQFLTGRTHPALVRMRVQANVGGLVVSAPGMSDLAVRRAMFNHLRPTGVWAYRFNAWWGDAEVDDWFSRYLGLGARLLYIGTVSNRRLRADPTVQFSFADGYPFLLVSEASVAELNARLARPVTVRNFRPNLVVSGCGPYMEDHWKRIRIGDVEFEHMKACDRCVFTTIDPDTGVPDADLQPLRTLGTYRRTEAGVVFGQNLVARGEGVIRIGDSVEVIETVTSGGNSAPLG